MTHYQNTVISKCLISKAQPDTLFRYNGKSSKDADTLKKPSGLSDKQKPEINEIQKYFIAGTRQPTLVVG